MHSARGVEPVSKVENVRRSSRARSRRRRPRDFRRRRSSSPGRARPRQPETGSGRDWRCLRRHRDVAAVRDQGVRDVAARGRAGQRQHLRGAVAGLLVDHAGGLAQVPVLRDARRQRRRGGSPRADGAGRPPAAGGAAHGVVDRIAAPGEEDLERPLPRADDPDHARPVRRGPALWRRRHHAGDLGSVGGRGARGGDHGVFAVRRSHHLHHPGHALRRAEAWHRRDRRGVRAADAVLVLRDRGHRLAVGGAPPGDLARGESALRRALLRGARPARVPGARLRRPVRHRRRGAVRRHGALRDARDSHRLVPLRLPGAAHQLLRPGSDAARAPRRGEQPVLRHGARARCFCRWCCWRRWRPWWRRRR